jgi:membrane associated rhomboid family serine protease
MIFDVFLLSTIVTTGYLGQMVLRRLGPGQRAYGFMLLADLALAGFALAARSGGVDEVDGGSGLGDLIGTIALGGAACLVVLPPMLRRWGRRLVAAERLRLARAVCDLRELLQPGMGARPEREVIDTILAVRAGRVDEAVSGLAARRQAAEQPAARRYFDERIALTYLYGRRWDEAIALYESALERSAGPQLDVEMVRAYCEVGRLARAAELVERLEASPLVDEPVLGLLVERARLVFLAFVGRPAAVDVLVGRKGALAQMAPPARAFWSGVARLHAGDRPGARASLELARRLGGRGGRARELAETVLAEVDRTPARTLEPPIAALADRLAGGVGARRAAATSAVPRLSGVPIGRIPVTAALVMANVAVAVVVAGLVGDTTDLGVLMQAGANLKPATRDGELWRLVSSMFLHVGVVHLVVNLMGLWVLGRLIEQMIGPARFLVLYVGAGIAGSVASAWLGGDAPSVGASGAVFGLLGAGLVELWVYGRAYPEAWRRSLRGTLGFLTVANLGMGLVVPMLDQAAHVGGLLGGAALALVLTRRARAAGHGVAKGAVAVLALGALAALAVGAIGAARADLGATIAALPTAIREIDGLSVVVPTDFVAVRGGAGLEAPGLAIDNLILQRAADGRSQVDVDTALAERVDVLVTSEAREAGYRNTRPAARALVTLPAPWRGRELELDVEAGGMRQALRTVVFARESAGELWMGILIYPAALGADVGPMLGRMLGSATPVGG